MVDFATLQQARQGLQKSDTQRHRQSAELYAQGRQLMREALGESLVKLKLKQATDCFVRGIQLNHRNPDNFLGMALLLMLIGKTREALQYIKTALEIDQQSALGRELLQQAQLIFHGQSAATASATDTPPSPLVSRLSASEIINIDDLRDRTESALMLLLKQIMGDEVMASPPTTSPKHYEQFQAKLKMFQGRAEEFQSQFQVLDQELEVSDLRRRLATVDLALKRIFNLVELSKEFISIQADIQTHRDMTLHVTAESEATVDPNDIGRLEETLQVLLDHCDGTADRLDDFENKRINISPLKSPYQDYVSDLEKFQDVLEETVERLQSA